jgi:hypothetical protein
MKLKKAYRIVTFLPVGEEYITVCEMIRVLNEKFDIAYGKYRDVAYYSTGVEQYEPCNGANPAHGRNGELTKVESVRLEISIPDDAVLLEKIIEELCVLHPWEEPVVQAYEVLETHTH